MDSVIVQVYESLVKRLLEHKTLIPSDRFSEVQFEVFERQPLVELERIYRELGMTFESARGPCSQYADLQQRYVKNTYSFDETELSKIERHWGFALEQWCYSRAPI